MLARLHQAAASYHAPQRGTHLLVARERPGLDEQVLPRRDRVAHLSGHLDLART